MNVAVIFAGGTGQRMNTKVTPKQFLEVHGKPIIIYTLEQFEEHDEIDGIVIVCLVDWIDHLKKTAQQVWDPQGKGDRTRRRNRTDVHFCRHFQSPRAVFRR